MALELRLTSPDRQSHILLSITESVLESYPSIRVVVSVKDGDFTAKTPVWIERDELREFLSAVEACEDTRTGGAQLASMSPGDLQLQLAQRDSAGHFTVRYEVGAYKSFSSIGVRQSLAGEFLFDSEMFVEFVRELHALVAQAFRGCAAR